MLIQRALFCLLLRCRDALHLFCLSETGMVRRLLWPCAIYTYVHTDVYHTHMYTYVTTRTFPQHQVVPNNLQHLVHAGEHLCWFVVCVYVRVRRSRERHHITWRACVGGNVGGGRHRIVRACMKWEGAETHARVCLSRDMDKASTPLNQTDMHVPSSSGPLFPLASPPKKSSCCTAPSWLRRARSRGLRACIRASLPSNSSRI